MSCSFYQRAFHRPNLWPMRKSDDLFVFSPLNGFIPCRPLCTKWDTIWACVIPAEAPPSPMRTVPDTWAFPLPSHGLRKSVTMRRSIGNLDGMRNINGPWSIKIFPARVSFPSPRFRIIKKSPRHNMPFSCKSRTLFTCNSIAPSPTIAVSK